MAPLLPAEAPGAEPSVVAAPEQANGSQVSVGVITGITLLSDASQLVAGGVETTGVDASHVALLSESGFIAGLQAQLGKALTIGDLERIRGAIIAEMTRKGQPFAYVSIPPQSLAKGSVQIVVTQYRLGSVTIQSNHHFNPDHLARVLHFEVGSPVSLDLVDRRMSILSDNPFITVKALMRPGTRNGDTDLTFAVNDRLPFRLYAGYDNMGLRGTGLGETIVGFNWGNAFNQDQVLSYQYTRALTGRSETHSASYVVPVGDGDKLLFFGSYARFRPELPAILVSTGHSLQASTRYVFDLSKKHGVLDLQLGYDFKKTDNNLEFAGFQVFNEAEHIHQFSVTTDWRQPVGRGLFSVQNIVVGSPGGIGGHANSDEEFAKFSPGAKARYAYDRLTVSYIRPLGSTFESATRGVAQVATGNLASSEQLAGGGTGSARGFYPDTVFGTSGWIVSQELRLKPLHLGLFNKPQDELQLGVFIDASRVGDPDKVTGVGPSTSLASVGLTAHYSVNRFVDLRMDAGLPISHPDWVSGKPLFQISLTIGS